MPDRSKETFVTFQQDFTISDMIGSRSAGTYSVVIDEDEIGGLSFLAHHCVATLFHVPAIGASGSQQVFSIDPRHLDAAIAADRQATTEAEPGR